ncbi:MAG: helix-turn-helix domain-containing protein [Nitrososphaerales archaeon]
MSDCELCGNEITGPSFAIVVENIVINVCRSCSKRGKPYNLTTKKPEEAREEFSFSFPTVRSDYSRVIKEGRERLGLSLDELGSKIREGTSVIKLLEQGKFKPDPEMAKKIESYLGVKLIEGSGTDE